MDQLSDPFDSMLVGYPHVFFRNSDRKGCVDTCFNLTTCFLFLEKRVSCREKLATNKYKVDSTNPVL